MPEKNSDAWFVFAGGGTGGHLYPGLAVAASLRELKPDCRVTFLSTARPIDRQIVEPYGYEIVPQPVQPWNPRPWKWPAFWKAYRASIRQAAELFAERSPSAVLSLGGYAGAPPIMAARKLRAPTAVFNPDAVPGRANRRLIGKVDTVFVQWDTTLDVLGRPGHARVSGCPVRPEFLSLSREGGCAACGVDPKRPVIAITGASQGASSINRAAMALTDFWAEMSDWQIIHLTGKADYDEVRRAYAGKLPHAKVIDFTPKIAWVLAAADLVISRAGASTLAELCALGRASVLMPYPYDRKKHQHANAQVLASTGAAVIVEDRIDPVANAKALRPALKEMMISPERRRRIAHACRALSRENAADLIANALIEMSDVME